MRTYSFITEFKDNTYLGCYPGENHYQAFRMWMDDFISQPYVGNMQRKKIVEDSQDKDLDPSLLTNVECIWCWWINPWRKSLLVNFLETLNWDNEDSAYTYTFVVLFEGGTYITQHKGVSFDDSCRLWIEDFIGTPYLNDAQKKDLLSGFVRYDRSLIEENCNFKILRLPICDKQLNLYIAKTKIGNTAKCCGNSQ